VRRPVQVVATLKILVTGRNAHSGSFAIRGIQLGEAIGATIKPGATLDACRGADLIVVVKRINGAILEAVRQSGKPWVYDIVDAWRQPSEWQEEQSVQWLKSRIAMLQPSAMVFGTARMQADSEFKGASLILPHHSWSKYSPNDIRERLKVVGYEGDPTYLGRWESIIRRACDSLGLNFQINGDMRLADIGIALRDSGGYPARHWKPGTKLSNLHALGIPALCSPEDGYSSVASGAEFWISHEPEVKAALESLTSLEVRQKISATMQASAIRLSDVSETYKAWLSQVAKSFA
jgi:hypothetical protein